MPKWKLSHLINLGSYNKYKGILSYKESEPPQPDTVPPSMRSKAKRPGIYQPISSAFSRKSSSSPDSESPCSDLPAAPTAGNHSLLSIPTSRSQRMYQSISSAFSMMSSNSQESQSTHLPGASNYFSIFQFQREEAENISIHQLCLQ